MKLKWFSVTLVLAVGIAAAAQATSVREKQSSAVWRKQDDCAHAAFLKFPDYTPESNANRDRATRACEDENHVPASPPVILLPVKRIPDAAE